MREISGKPEAEPMTESTGHFGHKAVCHQSIQRFQLGEEGSKGLLRGKFKRARWDDDFLYRLLEMF